MGDARRVNPVAQALCSTARRDRIGTRQHLNRQGYLRLGVLLRAAVEAREPHSTGIGSHLRNVRETTEPNGSSVNAP